jgi:perosamine synthetase
MIPIAKPFFRNEEIEAVKSVMKSGFLVQGKKVKMFEVEFAQHIGVKNAVAVANGTVALDIALKILGIRQGDEVITPAFSFVASANCILYQNATPVFADIDKRTFNIKPSDAAEKVTRKTRAIIPVHLFGQTADMDSLKEVAEDKRMFLVEDASQAIGAECKSRKAGGMADVGCFSFYPTKNMTTGEGGMITTDDSKLAEKARLLRDHGQTSKYEHVILGYNYRMTEIAAAIGLVQLSRLDKLNAKRIENAKLLTKEIKNIPFLTPPHVDKNMKHVFSQYVVRVEKNCSMKRNDFANYLNKKGIETAVHYPIPIYKQHLYKELSYSKITCPNTEEASEQVLSLPVHPLVSKKDIAYITSVIKEVEYRC